MWRQGPCVLTSFLVTFSVFLPTPPLSFSFHLHLFLFPFPPPSTPLQTPLPLPTLLCDKLLLAVDLLVVKSAPCAGMKVGRAGEEVCTPPQFPSTPTAPHTCVSPRLSVEMSQWKLIFCLIRSHQIRCCPCLISSHIRFPTLLLTRLFLILARVGSRREGLLFAEEELEEEQERKMRASEQ